MIARRVKGYADGGRFNRRWYTHARAIVSRVAAATGCSTNRVADVLAITSPRCTVNRNLAVTCQYLQTGTVPADVTKSTRAALRYYESTGKIRGPKTSRFAAVLKGDESHLVVDTHIARAFGHDERAARTKRVREQILPIVQRIAKRRGWTIAATQAAIWAGYYRAAYPTGNVPRYKRELISVNVAGKGVPF